MNEKQFWFIATLLIIIAALLLVIYLKLDKLMWYVPASYDSIEEIRLNIQDINNSTQDLSKKVLQN